jgi:hypothetical protein
MPNKNEDRILCSTESPIDPPHQVNDLDEILQSDGLLTLRDMCVAFFKAASDGKTYTRSPSIALRLPHEDFIIVVKPTTRHDGGIVTVDQRGIVVECLCQLNHRQSAKWLTILVTDTVKKTRWLRDISLSIQAATALVKMAGNFVADPRSVIEKNKNNCCCCGKGLTDQVSRARGIGPECLERINTVFGLTTHKDNCNQIPDCLIETLGLSGDSTKEEARAKFKKLLVASHPDRGGSSDGFQSLNALKKEYPSILA